MLPPSSDLLCELSDGIINLIISLLGMYRIPTVLKIMESSWKEQQNITSIMFEEGGMFQIHLVNEDSKAKFDMEQFGDEEGMNRS